MHDLHIHEIVAPVSNREIVLLWFMVIGKFATYFTSLMMTLITLSVCDCHSESDEVLKLLLGLLESWWSTKFSVSNFGTFKLTRLAFTSLTCLVLLFVLQTCLSRLCKLL